MKVAIISDTHISKDTKKITLLMEKNFKQMDLIIHAGDYKDSQVIHALKNFKKFIGVWGNNDTDSIRALVNEREIFNLNGYVIGVYHGHGKDRTALNNAYEAFRGTKVDIIIFGHSHRPTIQTKEKVLMLNPGSPTSKRKEPWFSYITLELEKSTISATLNFF